MIKLTSKRFVVKQILRKTKAEFFKNVKVGDELVFSLVLEAAGRSFRGSAYTTYIDVENVDSGETGHVSLTTLSPLDAFELERVS